MTSRELDASATATAAAGDLPAGPSASVAGSQASTRASDPRQLDVAQVDVRFASLRLASPRELRRLQASVHSEGRIRDPVVVTTGVQEQRWVLVDGFKRLRIAQELGLTQVWAQPVHLDEAHAKAAIVQCNQTRQGLCELEEAWIVRSLCRDHGLKQADVAQLLQRDPSWVCRRLKLAEALEGSLQDDVRLGLLSATAARELSQLPRGKQLSGAQAVRDHQLSSRQSALLVKLITRTSDPQALREVLEDPMRYLAADGAKPARGGDPRLSEDGNRLRRVLLNWQDSCGHLARELQQTPAAADTVVLIRDLRDALRAGRRALRQLEATHSACSAQLPASSSGRSASAQATEHA